MFNHSSWRLAQTLKLDHRELRIFIDGLKDKLTAADFEQNFNRLKFEGVLNYYALTDEGLEILIKALD
jgi:hypothetical protein